MNLSRIVLLAGIASTTAQAGLLALWKLDSSPADELADFPATWGGNAAYSTAVVAPASSAAGEFDGSMWLSSWNNLVFERNRPFSACAWIKGGPQDSAVLGDMFHGNGNQGWELHVGSAGNGASGNSLTVWLNKDYPAISIEVNASANVLNDQWHHVAFTYDGSSTASGVDIYIDGVRAVTSTALDTLTADIANNGTARFNIGGRMQGTANMFTGRIDEVALFDHELNATEISVIRQSGAEHVSAPFISDSIPLHGQSVATLTSAEVHFSYPVTGVEAADLLVNGMPAATMTALDSKRYRFGFNSPPQGDVRFAWDPDHGITGTNGLAALPAEWTALHVPTLPPGQVIISEFLTRNVGGLEDEDHDTADWIELFNPGTADVDLAGWGLTDDPSRPLQWRLPSIVLRPGEYRVVFASGKDRSGTGGNLHTNFKLSQIGGYLALSDPSGAVFHVYDQYPQQEGNIAFGLLSTGKPSDGRKAWRYLPPTPAAAPGLTSFSAAMIGQVGFSPTLPGPGQEVTITLRPSPEAILSTTPALYYRIALTAEKKVDFHDDGLHGDGAAGDSLWAAVIPATAAGQLIRWRLSMNSTSAGESCWPVTKPTFASTIASPNYEGTVVSGGAGSGLMPVYQLFGNASSFDSSSGGRVTFFAEGRCYDNVLVRAKGTTTLRLAKTSHRIDFNPGREFIGTGEYPPQGELNLNAEYIDPSYLRQNVQLWMHRDSGNAGAPHFPVKLTLNNANWKLAFHTYSADGELLEVLGLDPRGALYKQVFTLNSTTGEKKTRRWEDKSDLAQLAAGISGNSEPEARSRFIHDNLHLPSVINYLAVARIAQECDDVWANMTVYRDSEGTREWRPIPFDINLSFGQLYFGDSPSTNNFVQADRDDNKSHPLYGSGACCPSYRPTTYNQLYDSIIKTPDTRAMLLRRIRTLMDRYLATSAAASPLEARFDSMGALISAEAVYDRSKWGWPTVTSFGPYGLGPGISPAQGLATLKSSFLDARRTHLYVTHSIHNTSKPIGLGNNDNAGIPDSQISDPLIHFGTIETQPVSGNQNEEFIELVNRGTEAVDVSDWTVAGRFKFAAGTVIPAGSSLFVSPDVVAFRSRSVSPKSNENRSVVGPFSGHLPAYGGSLNLENAYGKLIAQVALPVSPLAPPVSLTVTEILSSSRHDGTAANGDWWELTNNAVAPVDLTGFSWDDDRSMPFQAIFPHFTLGAGESAIILDEDDSAAFRAVWNLPASVKILTRADFGLSSFRGLGYGDSVIIYQPDGSQAARADYPAHSAGKSRAWLRSGAPVPGGFSEAGLFSAIASNSTPGDIASPGNAAADPAALATAYGAWTSMLDMWAESAHPDADPDRDGRTNRAEYVFGGSPRTADGLPPQTIRNVSGNLEWTFVRRSNDATIRFSLESSEDVDHWNSVDLPLLRTSPHPVMEDYEHATYSIPLDGKSRFFRARAD